MTGSSPAREPRPVAYKAAAAILRPFLMRVTRRDWHGTHNIPTSGGCVIVVNHLSDIDFALVAHVIHDAGRYPRFLAKSSLFTIPVAGKIVSGAGMIPVFRGSARAVDAFRAAVQAVKAGQCVVIYPEGTITDDPQLWPMKGKTGAARIALMTGCPVIPMATWGPQDILRRGVKGVHLWPRKTIQVAVGEPLDLSQFMRTGVDGQPEPASNTALHQATAQIMAAITGLQAQLRHQTPPAAAQAQPDAQSEPAAQSETAAQSEPAAPPQPAAPPA